MRLTVRSVFFVCLIYERHKVIFIGPVQIIKWWSFKCSVHLMLEKNGWKYDLIKRELSPKSKSQNIYGDKSVLNTSQPAGVDGWASWLLLQHD